MKIRIGFVSNSSSGSFVVWGMEVSVSRLRRPADVDPGEESLDLEWSSYARSAGLDAHYDYDNGELWVGLHPSKMKDDETLGQFKTKVEGLLKASNLFDDQEKIEISFVEQAWSDR